MKIKILLCLASILLISYCAQAQLSSIGYKSDEYAQFMASKTYCVKTGNAVYDKSIEAAMNANWKITPFAFITNEELKTKITDKSASFITLVLIGENNHGYHYLALINGGKKRISSYEYKDMIAYSIINRWGDEPLLTDCGWRVSNMLQGMVSVMDILQKQNITGNTKKIADRLQEYYNTKSPQIKKRTLLISETSMGKKFNKAECVGAYPFKVEVCSREKVEKAIADKSTEYYYLQLTSTLNSSKWVIDPSNGDIVYFNYSIMGMNIKKDDIKDLVEAIKK